MLSDIPMEALKTATIQLIAVSKFFPSIAEIRETANQLTSPAFQHMSAAEAWGVVKEQIRKEGWCGKPTFTDPLVAKVVRYMGWRDLCASESPEVDRAHFMKMYDSMLKREEQDARLISPARRLRDVTTEALLPQGQRLGVEIVKLADKLKME